MLPTDDLRNLDSVKQFVVCVDRYCNLLINHEQYEAYPFLCELAAALASLYLAALNLPEVQCKNPKADSVSYGPWMNHIPDGIVYKLGQHNIYWCVFDPYMKYDNDKFTTPILNDLYEIYQDLQKRWVSYQQGREDLVCDAIEGWKFDFEFHWGAHLVSVLNPIHWLISDPNLGVTPKSLYEDDLDEEE